MAIVGDIIPNEKMFIKFHKQWKNNPLPRIKTVPQREKCIK